MKKIVILISCSFIYGCLFIYECFPVINGVILDKNTGTKISNARIKLGNNISLSDKNGFFEISESSCGKIKLNISKEGYKPFEMEIWKSSRYKTYKIKSNLNWIEYPNKFYPDTLDRNYYLTGTWINQYSQDFETKSDTIIVYMDDNNVHKEFELIKQRFDSPVGSKLKPRNEG